jgi:hypothetical protein
VPAGICVQASGLLRAVAYALVLDAQLLVMVMLNGAADVVMGEGAGPRASGSARNRGDTQRWAVQGNLWRVQKGRWC